jgi:hypothetical protein
MQIIIDGYGCIYRDDSITTRREGKIEVRLSATDLTAYTTE